MTKFGTRRAKMMLMAASAALALAPSMAHAQQAQPARFDIQAQDLGTALTELARQSNREIYFSADLTRGKRAARLHGRMSVEQALQRILIGTGLRYRTSASGSIVIEAASGNSGRAATTSPKTGEPSTGKANANTPEMDGANADIVVTGTNIRGVSPIGSHLLVVTRADLERSGVASIPDAVRDLPQDFGGGVSEDDNSDLPAQNLNFGSSVNLRGLGASSTLVLVDGHRQPQGGLAGAFVDISSIPISAVDRIEVLTDGASALYGSDAIAGVLNFVLRKDYSGGEVGGRIISYDGSATEYVANGSVGTTWRAGHVLLGGSFDHRAALSRLSRRYTESDDLRPFGGTDFRSTLCHPGNILDENFLPAYAIPKGQPGTSLAASQLVSGTVNYCSLSDGADLLPDQKTYSGYLIGGQNLTSTLSTYFEGRISQRNTAARSTGLADYLTVPSSNPFYVNPMGGTDPVTVSYNFIHDLGPVVARSSDFTYGAVAGMKLDLNKWTIDLSANLAGENVRRALPGVNEGALAAALADTNPATAFNPFGDNALNNRNTLAAIADSLTIQRERNRVEEYNLVASGPLFRLPGGELKIALGANYRTESLFTNSEDITGGVSSQIAQSDHRGIFAQYAELSIPLFGDNNSSRFLKRLSVSAAIRHERYSDFGNTTNPKFGALWAPWTWLSFRGSWGKSFNAPRLSYLPTNPGGSNVIAKFDVFDPQSPSGASPVIIILGNNPSLRPERATTWTTGFDVKPSLLPGLTASVTYYRIRYTDKIAIGGPPGNPLGALVQPDIYSAIITRDPSQAQIDALCNSPLFVGGSAASCSSSPTNAILDLRYRNIAAVETSGVDFELGYRFRAAGGELSLNVDGTYVASFRQRQTPTAPSDELVNTVGSVPGWRFKADAQWSNALISAGVGVDFTQAGKNITTQPIQPEAAYATINANLSYKLSGISELLSRSSITVTVRNLANSTPPFADVQYYGYDTSKYDLYGRTVSLSLAFRW